MTAEKEVFEKLAYKPLTQGNVNVDVNGTQTTGVTASALLLFRTGEIRMKLSGLSNVILTNVFYHISMAIKAIYPWPSYFEAQNSKVDGWVSVPQQKYRHGGCFSFFYDYVNKKTHYSS